MRELSVLTADVPHTLMVGAIAALVLFFVVRNPRLVLAGIGMVVAGLVTVFGIAIALAMGSSLDD